MSNVIPIWPRDAVDTAQQFAAEADQAHRFCRECGRSRLVAIIDERGICRCCRLGLPVPKLFGRSRFRRARWMDAAAVALLMALMAALGAIALILATPQAKAEPAGEGCVSDFWMYQGLRASQRMICDSERRPDGSWTRARGFFADAYYKPFQCGRYSCWGGYWVPELKVMERYVVTDDTVLHDEPGWIPSSDGRVIA